MTIQPVDSTPMQCSYTLNVNGQHHEVIDSWIGESLLHVLRERLGLPGSKSACEQGECGSCSLLVDDLLVCSCLIPAATLSEARITTVESLGSAESLSVVQQTFVDAGAVQCGFCTPGLIMAVDNLLADAHEPTDFEIREALSGNLCRCTGYGRVLEAVAKAIETSP